jgi:hypothetical protein
MPRTIACIATCLVFLAIAEVATRLALPVIADLPGFYGGAGTYVLAERPRDQRRILWLIGDSTVLGLDLPRTETLGFLLGEAAQENGGRVEVRTVGLRGLGLLEAAAIANGLPLRPGDTLLLQVHLAYATRVQPPRLGSAIVSANGAWKDRVDSELARGWQSSSIVRNRRFIARLPFLLFKGLFPSLGSRLLDDKPGEVRRREWTTGALTARDLEHLASTYGPVGGDTAGEIVAQLTQAESFFVDREVEVVAYISPLNHQIVNRYRYANWQTLADTAASATEGCRRNGIACLNLIDAVPPEAFFDDDHLDPSGYRVMLNKLESWDVLKLGQR